MHEREIMDWPHLDPAVRKLWRIEATIAGSIYLALLTGAGFIVNAALSPPPVHFGLVGAIAGVAAFIWALYVAGLKYEFWRYLIGEDDLAVSHGIWWRTRIYVPRARIQHVDVTAGPVSRALGLAVVTVFVSGHGGAVATIPGLRADEAERVRQVLLRLNEQLGAPPVIALSENPRG